MDFSSDNAAPAHPDILNAIAAANEGMAGSYGADRWTLRLTERLENLFERELLAFPVITGTAANSLAFSAVVPPWGAAFAHEEAHLANDECGAPEFFAGGAKLIGIPGAHAKIDVEGLKTAIAAHMNRGVHTVQPRAVSLTQSTERGTVYSLAQTEALSRAAHEAGLAVHLDGARLANALAFLGASPAAATWRSGIDLLSLGATKGGAIASEVLVVFDRAVGEEIAYRRKRSGHLLSKMRYVSAQMLAFLENELWLRLAAEANARASALADGLADRGVEIEDPVEANEVFAWLPIGLADRLLKEGAKFYPWLGMPVEGRNLYRFVCSFATAQSAVQAFLALVDRVRKETG